MYGTDIRDRLLGYEYLVVLRGVTPLPYPSQPPTAYEGPTTTPSQGTRHHISGTGRHRR
jgi:hypothetical protein